MFYPKNRRYADENIALQINGFTSGGSNSLASLPKNNLVAWLSSASPTTLYVYDPASARIIYSQQIAPYIVENSQVAIGPSGDIVVNWVTKNGTVESLIISPEGIPVTIPAALNRFSPIFVQQR